MAEISSAHLIENEAAECAKISPSENTIKYHVSVQLYYLDHLILLWTFPTRLIYLPPKRSNNLAVFLCTWHKYARENEI